MKTIILNETTISQGAELLRKKELVAFPTETVYGLGAGIFFPEAIQKIYQVKGRPSDNPLIAHVGSLEQCKQLALFLSPLFYKLAEAFFPGPLTLIVDKAPSVPEIVSGGLKTVAIRMPSHPIANQLINQVGMPLAAPSANLSGRPSSTKVEHVIHDFNGKIAAVIDGGVTRFGLESTVVDLVSFEGPTLMRHGALKKEAIEKVLGKSLATYSEGPNSSPGMRYRHYAPDIPVSVFRDREEFETYRTKPNLLILSTEEHPFFYIPLQSKTLYATLRLAEKNGYDEIIIFCPGKVDPALQNRLEKITYEDNLH